MGGEVERGGGLRGDGVKIGGWRGGGSVVVLGEVAREEDGIVWQVCRVVLYV